MGIAIILLLVAGSSLAVMILTRQWALEENGVDLDHDGMDLKDLESFSGRQKLILGLLLVPALIFVVIGAGYALSSLAVA